MKSPTYFSASYFWLIAVLTCFMVCQTAVMAQEPVVQSGAPVAITPVPAAPVTPPTPDAPVAPKVTARKEDEAETPAAPAAPAPINPNLSFLKQAVAKFAGIPTQTSNASALAAVTAERDTLRQQLATVQAALATSSASVATAHADASAARAELAELNTFLDQLRTAPANILAQDPATLSPAHAAAATAISHGVAAELQSIGQPASRLPGPGAANPDTGKETATTPRPTDLATVAANYWKHKKAPWTLAAN